MEHTEWLSRYHASIKLCVERYQKMAEGHPDIIEFLEEFSDDVPLMKICRWVGYVQGVLIERGVTTVEIERDWTRPLFRPLDFPNELPTVETAAPDDLEDWKTPKVEAGDWTNDPLLKEAIETGDSKKALAFLERLVPPK